MSKPKERTLQDICHASSAIPQTQATSQIQKGFDSCSDRSQNVDYRGKSGKCNMCYAPCSSCFHMNEALMKSKEESAGETCAENIVIDHEMSTVDTVISTSVSSENAVCKAFSRTSDASASNEIVEFEAQKIPDDCLSCDSGTNEATKLFTFHNRKVDDTGFFETLDSKRTGHGTGLLMEKDTSTSKYLSCDRNLRDMEEDKCSTLHGSHSEVSSQHLNSLPTGDAVTDICGNLPATTLNFAEKNVDAGVEIHLIDDADDSDMMEQDVKVCDICGDAGREDLLAVCCRCIDGAEHTYCMRERMSKVPEGDWLCEECKSKERMRSQRQDKIGKVDSNEKSNSSGHAISEHVNSVDVEGNRSRSRVKIPGKRIRGDGDAEVSSIVKKPEVESMVRLPKSSWPDGAAALTCENSLDNLDKGRLQSSHGGPSSDAISVKDNPKLACSASDLRVHNFQGTFSRSNSFTSINSKPKVKLVDQVLRRQKSVKEVAPHQLKEGGIRTTDKSMLFKAINSKDIPEMKNTKQRNTFERQSSFKSKHAPINSMIETSVSYVSRSDKKQASGVELCQLSILTNHLETRSVQPDGKSAALSRSYSLSSRKGSDLPSSLGEFKRPSLHRRNAHGVLSAEGVNNIDKNSNQSNSKADSSSCSGVSERSPFNADEGQPDRWSRSRESSTSGELLREHSGSCSRLSYANSSWDKNNNLKAAIQAAMLRKPGVYQKYRSDDASTSNMGCDIASKDHLSSYAARGIESSAAEVADKHALSQTSSADTLRQESLNNTKHFSLEPVEAPSVGANIQMLDWKVSSRDMFSNAAAAMTFFSKSLAIPKHEYIWQGSFDIWRSGKMFVSWDGIQAHLSIRTSPKVLHTVNKFKNRIILYEVPRLSTWPVQFQEGGVVEDNIALFFFAKDLESYNKIYNVWLENLMKNDLALKGNVNGVELLIFPSNQLPENSQRWNMLFFLWGVFRGKKECCLEHMPDTLKQFSTTTNLPTDTNSLPENTCSLSPRAKDLPACRAVSHEPKLHTSSIESCSLLSYRAIDGDCDAKVFSVDCSDGRLNSSSATAARSFTAKHCQELRDNFLEEGISSSNRPLQGGWTIDDSGREQMPMKLDSPLGSQHPLYHLDKSLHQVKSCMDAKNDTTRDQLCGALEKMNRHVASGNQHHVAEHPENAKRHFFPMDRSSPWEARSSEQIVFHDRVPDLELALGAERKQSTRVSQLVMVGKLERKMTEEYILDEAALKEEDDESAALSLSLSCPLAKEK